jgi:hypothetical protein
MNDELQTGAAYFRHPHELDALRTMAHIQRAELIGLRMVNEQLRQERDALKVEYESRAIWIAEMNKILGYDNTDGMHSEPTPFEIAKQLRQRVKELGEEIQHNYEMSLDYMRERDAAREKIKELESGEVYSKHADESLVWTTANANLTSANIALEKRVKELEVELERATHDRNKQHVVTAQKYESTIQQLTAMLKKVTCRGFDGPWYCTPDDPCVSCQFHKWQEGQTK